MTFRQIKKDHRAEIETRDAEIASLTAALDEREADMHARIRAGYDKTVADAWRAEVAKRDAEIARLTAELAETRTRLRDAHARHSVDVIADLRAELAAARAEVDCGQSGPCAKAPGCARHWQERNRELVDELAAARAVPADVEAAIEAVTSGVFSTTLENVHIPRLRAAIAGAIATAEQRAVCEFIDRHAKRLCEQAGHAWNRDDEEAEEWASDVHDVLNHLRADETGNVHDGRKAATPPPTVGGLLATAPVGKLLGAHAVTEWYIAPDWYQARIAQDGHGMVRRADMRWRHENARSWSTWGQPWGDPSQHMDVLGRHVPAAESDLDPSTRGPLPKGG